MIQCKEYANGRCHAEVCWNGRKPRCGRYQPDRKIEAYGWDVTVRFHSGPDKTFHWRGCSAAAARRKSMLKTLAREIVNIEPLTEDQWIRAYGDPTLKNES